MTIDLPLCLPLGLLLLLFLLLLTGGLPLAHRGLSKVELLHVQAPEYGDGAAVSDGQDVAALVCAVAIAVAVVLLLFAALL